MPNHEERAVGLAHVFERRRAIMDSSIVRLLKREKEMSVDNIAMQVCECERVCVCVCVCVLRIHVCAETFLFLILRGERSVLTTADGGVTCIMLSFSF